MKKNLMLIFIFLFLSVSFFALSEDMQYNFSKERKEATSYTQKMFEEFINKMNIDDPEERKLAEKNWIERIPDFEIYDDNGNLVWTQKEYEFLEGEIWDIPTIHPSLWRNASMNHIYGLFEVTNPEEDVEHRIYQVRGYDLANMTFVESDNGWIVIDPLFSQEAATAALEIVEKNLGKREIKAVIVTHSHVDHYGGLFAVISQEEVCEDGKEPQPGEKRFIVPENFVECVVSENVYSGNAMSRRSEYQYGGFIQRDEKGLVSSGLGLETSNGRITFLLPGEIITKTGEKKIIDGVEVEFQLVPNAEAPSDMIFYFPEQKALCLADNCDATLANIYTLRGAEVRDALQWSKYLVETYELFGQDVEIAFQSHNWPRWGNQEIEEFLLYTAQIYRYIHDQTLHFANQGFSAEETAEIIELSSGLEEIWYIRPYYGTVAHNSKGVFQKYLGWYDNNPVNLNPLPDVESAEKYVQYMGGAENILEKAVEDFNNGEYRWVAEVTSKIVYADPNNMNARLLCADALEQLGYQSESGIWRNNYLSGAYELRNGIRPSDKAYKAESNIQKYMFPSMIIDYMGILIDGKKAEDLNLVLDIKLTDVKENYQLVFENGTLLVFNYPGPKKADITFEMEKEGLFYFLKKSLPPENLITKVSGDLEKINDLFDVMDIFTPDFPLVTPLPYFLDNGY